MDALHLTTAHKSTDTRIFDKEAKSLVNSGFDVGIVAHGAPEPSLDGVNFYSLGNADSRVERWRSLYQIARTAEDINPDIYHFHDPELLPVGVYLSNATSNAVIYDVHENYGHVASMREWIPIGVSNVLSRSIPSLEKAAASQFDAIVTVADWIGEPFAGVADTIQTIHNFPRTQSLPSIETGIESDSEYTLCFAGGLVGVRGIHQMLKLLRYLVADGVDVELWALGSWMPDADRAKAEQFIKENNLEDYVTFPGYLNYEKMFQYLQSADVGLALLDTEHCKYSIPTKYFEYLYAGLPVVTTPISAADCYLPDEYKYVTPQDDTEAAAEAVSKALDADCDIGSMQHVVEQKYSWEREAQKLIALYDELLD